MFLKPSQFVIPTQLNDYPDWHLGRQDYAIWYLEINDPELLEYLTQLRAYFSKFLFQPNTRQFHITLFICGFLTEKTPVLNDDFSIEQLKQQIQLLIQENIQSFTLKIDKINSFESALYVEVLDHQNSLSKIRALLSKSQNEIAALSYCPHITLGLYPSAFNSDTIFAKIKAIQQQSFEISVNQLSFGCYKAKELQGPLYPYQQIYLSTL
ncbi:2'-5' RNA ligase family protein [Acinetobacter sp. ANC 4648]|uniref:2'-5' RNA ligase family protein n=1 Tax=Acinetobacter sp. ANC 4648 TaxID=1977875 RepID=UPI000A32C9BE|nr:2'-5' RNA ligase family protein [Acinetobacter sp. ANC 4648]OTG80376.1 2'-5' RNA ligase [Acinetobacter sp. ANC 4648]